MSRDALVVTVDNHRCHRYGVCAAEAPDVFRLTTDGRLDYRRRPPVGSQREALAAARCCPMQAIHVEAR
ncbi:MAG TPA: ferredoxin [Amycolatopsis sp.]|nr:ferredoxin [Amycolatopsis sp.]